LKHEQNEIANLKNKADKEQVWRGKMYVVLSCKHFEMFLIEFMAVQRVILKVPAKKYFLCDTKLFLFFQIHADNQKY